MKLRFADEHDASACLAIYAQYIDTSITFETALPSEAEFAGRIRSYGAEQLPRRMLRQRLRDTLGQEYCAQHGLEFTKVNPPEQMTKYVDQYLDNLLEAHRSEIKYY